MRRILSNQGGFATLIALLMIGMLTLIGLAVLSSSDNEVTIAGNELQDMRSFYAAEAGLQKAAARLQYAYDSTNAPPTVMPAGSDTLNQCVVAYTTVDNGPAQQRNLEQGALAGLHALIKSFSITSTGVSLIDRARVQMSESFETALVPIFQFAVFYGNDLEIAPGPDMTLIGRVHSNGNLWLQANSSLRLDSYVTASGDILHGRKGPGSAGNGDVLIKNADGNYVSMKDGSGWLQATDSYWYDSSVARWQGRVQDAAHGQGELQVPLNGASDDPHKLIEPATGNPDSYENKATLKFINGTAYKKVGGVWTDMTASMIADGVIQFNNNQFYDGREGTNVDVMELDVKKMYENGYQPDNGVIYFSDGGSGYPALRLKDGAELKAPLTVASENPVYTLGDYNKTNKKPAAIMADAVTFLSGTWDDSKGALNKNNRVATPTVVNASFLTGNVETTSSDYSGGLENLPRFLEVWDGTKFTWRGSMVNLWNSRQADGTWNGNYYSPPIRDWAYDTDLDNPNKLPPETPVVRIFQSIGWKQEYVGYN